MRYRRNKFGAVRTNGFASKKEARRHDELCLLRKAGEIRDLSLQMPFPLLVRTPEGQMVCIGQYVCDFDYYDVRTGQRVIEDVKGVRTPVYRLKKKHVEAQYGITITEV